MKTVTNVLVVTAPRFAEMLNGTRICTFRVADNQIDDGFTYWYTITGFDEMAVTMKENLSKGQRINVSGEMTERLYVNSFEEEEILYEIRAEHLSINSADFDNLRVEDQAEVDAVADSVAEVKEPHICTCHLCRL
jgi:single-stranded DNA-binding protein